jgi:hypothetical protein
LIVLGLIGVLAAGAVGLAQLEEPDRSPRAAVAPSPDTTASPDPSPSQTTSPGPAVREGPATYRFIDRTAGAPWRWDPCTPIAYVTNLQNAPRGAMSDLRTAIARVEDATGLRFTYDGPTDEVARPTRKIYQRARYGDRWAPVLIDWHDPRRSAFQWQLKDGDLWALGLAAPRWPPDRAGVFVSGTIVLNARDRGPAGFGWPWSRGVTIQHELGHLVGLAHVKAPDQVMSTDGYSTAKRYGEGDLAGLAQLGDAAGCVNDPPEPGP